MLKTQKTKHAAANAPKKWWLVDLEGKILGRVATKIAHILRGKNKSTFSNHLDTGDFVVAINCSKIKLTGKKWEDKKYHFHSGYPGGLKTESAKEALQKHPEDLLLSAVKGMLPKNDLSRVLLKKLKVYPDAKHPHASQSPQPIGAL